MPYIKEDLEKSEQPEDTDALFKQGLKYAYGRGVEKDEATAVYFYEKAARQNCARAQCNLGAMYSKGLGVKKDETTAVYW